MHTDNTPVSFYGDGSATRPVALLIPVNGAVDFNKPITTDTDLSARLLGQINDSLYPFVVVVTADEIDTPYQVDNDGEIKGDAAFTIENEQEDQPEVDVEGRKVIRQPVAVPHIMRRPVRTKKGDGTVVQLRTDEKRPFGVLLNSRRHDTVPEIFWALASKITFI